MDKLRAALVNALGGMTHQQHQTILEKRELLGAKAIDFANFEIKLLKERLLTYKAQMQTATMVILKLEETVKLQSTALHAQDDALNVAAKIINGDDTPAEDPSEEPKVPTNATLH